MMASLRHGLVALGLALGACTDLYDYDPATAGEAEEGTRAPRAKSPAQFVRGIYADVVGRAPERYDFSLRIDGQEALRFPLDEEAQLVDVLDGLGDSQPMRNLIAKGLLHSAEVSIPDKASVDPVEFITDQFRTLLGRDPNPYELATFTDEWRLQPAVGPRTIIRAIVGSREYQSQ